MKANVLIAASAGTGKTQALAERLIALVKGGLEPHVVKRVSNAIRSEERCSFKYDLR